MSEDVSESEKFLREELIKVLRNIWVIGIMSKGIVWSSLARNGVGYVLTRLLGTNDGLDPGMFIYTHNGRLRNTFPYSCKPLIWQIE